MLEIIGQAQRYLRDQGIDQWQDGYPDEAVVREDIRLRQGYVLEREGKVLGIASIVFGGEPTYEVIYEGAWTTEAPYASIHRVALDEAARGTGAADEIMREAEAIVLARGVHAIRIDTHRENRVMRGMLGRNGYTPSGVIYLASGAPRVALEKKL